jgi:hypothetical protein
LHVVLTVSEIRVKGYPYYRLNLPKDVSNALKLQKGDTITVDVKAVKRDGQIIYTAGEANSG